MAYFATASGVPTGLQFVHRQAGLSSSGGPQLNARLLNHGLLQEERCGQMFVVRPGPSCADAVHAFQRALAPWETVMDRVADLFLRMNEEEAERAMLALKQHLKRVRKTLGTEAYCPATPCVEDIGLPLRCG